ncbi:hypothetical protein FHW69_000787 [Luteibacter sp. Sphag1AF]|nr:hypothetical protein [Luteibacter sp. Sphag1AF]MBB3226197.1 hypothetical protein [Luteibacter sp. Sphag1AF]
MSQTLQDQDMAARKKRARRTALIMACVAIAIFVLSIVQMLHV